MRRLTVYDFDAANGVAFDGGAYRFVYAVDSAVNVSSAGASVRIEADNGRFFNGPIEISGTGWMFELADATVPLAISRDLDPALSHRLDPAAFDGAAMLRADRVASDPGARTPLHGHRGPGIRRLVKGRIRATIGDNLDRIEAGQAWFETGKDWVIGENISQSENVFVRVMLLPAELAGGVSSFVPATPDQATRPRAVTYRLFGEMEIEDSPLG